MVTGILILLTVFILLAEHYFPHWQEWTGRKLPDPVRLVLNYAAGTVAWFGPFSVWLWSEGYGRAALMGWGFVVVAGVTVWFSYRYDRAVQARYHVQDLEELKAMLEKKRQDAESERVRPSGDAEA